MAFLHVRGTRAAWQHLTTENEALDTVMREQSKSDWKSSLLQGCEAWQWHRAHCTTKATSNKEYHLCNWNTGDLGKKSVCIHRKQDLQENEP